MSDNYTKFRVIGRGLFPLDMLRFDACWPADTRSAMNIGDDNLHGEKKLMWYRQRRVVTLRTAMRSPTPARWSSFGWSVVNEELFPGVRDEMLEHYFNGSGTELKLTID